MKYYQIACLKELLSKIKEENICHTPINLEDELEI